MGIALGEARGTSSADALFRSLRSHSALFPIRGRARVNPWTMPLMPAFAMFSRKDHPCWPSTTAAATPTTTFAPSTGSAAPPRLPDAAVLDPVDPRACGPRSARSSSPATRQGVRNVSSIWTATPWCRWTARLIFPPPRSIRLVPGEAASQRQHHPFPSTAGGDPCPSRPQGGDPAGTRADHPAGRSDQERLQRNATRRWLKSFRQEASLPAGHRRRRRPQRANAPHPTPLSIFSA